MEKARLNGQGGKYDVAAVRSLFELKQVTAVLEFVEELQRPSSTTPVASPEVRRPKR
jgi:hypothetical protein